MTFPFQSSLWFLCYLYIDLVHFFIGYVYRIREIPWDGSSNRVPTKGRIPFWWWKWISTCNTENRMKQDINICDLHITTSECIFDLYSASSESKQNNYHTFNLTSYEAIIYIYISEHLETFFPSIFIFFFSQVKTCFKC